MLVHVLRLIVGCRGDCTRPQDLRGTETFVLGRMFERSRVTEISVLGSVFSGVQRRLYQAACLRDRGIQRYLYQAVCLAGYRDVCTRPFCLRDRRVQRYLYQAVCLAGYRDVCTRPLVCGDCGGTKWTTVLTTLVERRLYQAMMRYAIIALVVASLVHQTYVECFVWCNRRRVCFMLELGLHFSSAMNSVSGLRFSIPIPHWAIPLSLTPPSFPFQVRPMSRSDYTGPVLLGFYYYRALDFYHFYRFIAFGPLGSYPSFMLSRISDFLFMSYFIFRMLSLLDLQALWYRIDFYIYKWRFH